MTGRPRIGILFVALMTLISGLGAVHAAVSAKASDRGLERSAHGVKRGERFRIHALELEGEPAPVTLDLDRFEVFSPDAVVLVDDASFPPPANAFFRGAIEGEPDSLAYLSVRERGGIGGLVLRRGQIFALGRAPGRGSDGLRSRRVDLSAVRDEEFRCDASERPPRPRAETFSLEASPAPAAMTGPHTARVAIETDYEYFAKLGSVSAALDYMADIVGYGSVLYEREVNTRLQIGFSRLWTTGPGSDPWGAGSSSAALGELRSYWNANMSHVDRSLVHMLSGKNLGGGIAYLGVLCYADAFPSDSYDYGVSGNLDGDFNWNGDPATDPAAVVWDVVVVNHELGHNFDADHTHETCGLGGVSSPVDRCASGCAGSAQGLPSCGSPPSAFDGGPGTIMSYCHLLSGGMSNVSLTFGRDHTCGVSPERVPSAMSSYVDEIAAFYPACLASPDCGNGVVDAGEECDGTDLGGATCASQGFFGGTLACNASCTYDTSQCHDCGNGAIDPGETCDGSNLGGASCGDFLCTGGSLGCNATCDAYDLSSCTGCPPCDRDGFCDAGEDCNGCPDDCESGTTAGAVCGNGTCEAGAGESCVSCAVDCAGVQNGKPSGRYCCGDGSGSNPVSCSDPRCTAGGLGCHADPVEPASYCCGDDVCEGAETCGSCSIDCTTGPEVCTGNIDEDCNLAVDCEDAACTTDPACEAPACRSTGEACSSHTDCCSGNCQSKGKSGPKCR